MIDIVREIEAVQREVGGGQAGDPRVVRLRRTYEAPIEDVWEALTNPERISRWFLPISGDYRIGGRFQFEGNAGGEILACERPHRLRVSWGDESSVVELRLAPADADSTILELEHTAVVPDEMWAQFGPGAVGVGWEGGLMGLSLHLHGGSIADPMAWQVSDEGRAYYGRSSEAWGAANVAAGADPEAAATAVVNTTAFYAPEPDATA
ncbi:MAG TPA: SRPBCC family protein [Candidatus Limnocylindrales bacterium]